MAGLKTAAADFDDPAVYGAMDEWVQSLEERDPDLFERLKEMFKEELTRATRILDNLNSGIEVSFKDKAFIERIKKDASYTTLSEESRE